LSWRRNRENNRFADRHIADFEARIAEPQLKQGNEVGQHSANASHKDRVRG